MPRPCHDAGISFAGPETIFWLVLEACLSWCQLPPGLPRAVVEKEHTQGQAKALSAITHNNSNLVYSIVSFIYPNLPFLPHNLSGKYYFDFHWQMRKLRQREKRHALQILPRPTHNPQVRPGGHLQPWCTVVVICQLLPASSYLHPRHARKLMCPVTMLKSWWVKTLASLALRGQF